MHLLLSWFDEQHAPGFDSMQGRAIVVRCVLPERYCYSSLSVAALAADPPFSECISNADYGGGFAQLTDSPNAGEIWLWPCAVIKIR